MEQTRCGFSPHFRPRLSLQPLCLVTETVNALNVDWSDQYGLNTPVNLYGKHPFT